MKKKKLEANDVLNIPGLDVKLWGSPADNWETVIAMAQDCNMKPEDVAALIYREGKRTNPLHRYVFCSNIYDLAERLKKKFKSKYVNYDGRDYRRPAQQSHEEWAINILLASKDFSNQWLQLSKPKKKETTNIKFRKAILKYYKRTMKLEKKEIVYFAKVTGASGKKLEFLDIK